MRKEKKKNQHRRRATHSKGGGCRRKARAFVSSLFPSEVDTADRMVTGQTREWRSRKASRVISRILESSRCGRDYVTVPSGWGCCQSDLQSPFQLVDTPPTPPLARCAPTRDTEATDTSARKRDQTPARDRIRKRRRSLGVSTPRRSHALEFLS